MPQTIPLRSQPAALSHDQDPAAPVTDMAYRYRLCLQTALPTDGLERKELWLRKHVVEACQRVAQDRNRIWDAAAADFEMLQTVMGDVSQFLAFISRELDETHKMIASTHAELDAMRHGDEDDEVESRRASGDGNEPAAPYRLTQREETAGGGGGGAKNLLRDFDTLRRQLRTNRIKAGKISLDAHGAALLHVLHLRQREHMRQVCLPIQLFDDNTSSGLCTREPGAGTQENHSRGNPCTPRGQCVMPALLYTLGEVHFWQPVERLALR